VKSILYTCIVWEGVGLTADLTKSYLLIHRSHNLGFANKRIARHTERPLSMMISRMIMNTYHHVSHLLTKTKVLNDSQRNAGNFL